MKKYLWILCIVALIFSGFSGIADESNIASASDGRLVSSDRSAGSGGASAAPEPLPAAEEIFVSSSAEGKSAAGSPSESYSVQQLAAALPSASAAIQQIAVYYYPSLLDVLPEPARIAAANRSIQEINQLIGKLDRQEKEFLSHYVPAALELYDYYEQPKAYLSKHPASDAKADKEREAKARDLSRELASYRVQSPTPTPSGMAGQAVAGKIVTLAEPSASPSATPSPTPVTSGNPSPSPSATPNPYVVNPFKNEYRYQVDTDDLVDPLYRTANQKNVDLSLDGKPGLDLSFERRYNSLQSTVLNPEYTTQVDANGTYLQIKGNTTTPVKPENLKGFIATGWQLNLPSLERDTIQAELVNWHKPTTGTNNYEDGYSLKQLSSPYEKAQFTLEDGSQYEFRNGVLYQEPYANVVYSKQGSEYSLTVDDQITYIFNEKGEILRKENDLGDKIVFSYNRNPALGHLNITVTDSYGRTVTIRRNTESVITGLKAEGSAGVIKDITYESAKVSTPVTSRKWKDYVYKTSTETVTYWQLNKVMDRTQPQSPFEVEGYQYYPIDSSRLADFNFKTDGMNYFANAAGEPAEDSDGWSWKADGKLIELEEVELARLEMYAEVPYLLLKTISFFNGLEVQFNYQTYNPSWSATINGAISAREVARNTTRLYQDPFATQHISYHAVERVDHRYTENGQVKLQSDYYDLLHLDHGHIYYEYWKGGKANNPRLRQSSRFGDQQTIRTRTPGPSGTETATYAYYAINGKEFLQTFAWKEVGGSNTFTLSQDGTEYKNRKYLVEAYEYDPGKTKPKAVHVYADDIPDYSAAIYSTALQVSNIQHPLLPAGNGRITRTLQYNAYGQTISETDALGNVTSYRYEGPGRRISEMTVTAQDGSSVVREAYAYFADTDPEPLKRKLLSQTVRTEQYPNPENPAETLTQTDTTAYLAYDASRQPTRIRESGAGNPYGTAPTATERELVYTPYGQVERETTFAALAEGEAPAGLVLTHEYEPGGLLHKTLYPDGSAEEFAYDGRDRTVRHTYAAVGAPARTTTVSYDDSTRKVAVTLPDGELQESFYTPYGLEIRSQQTAGGATRVLTVQETANGRLATRTLPYGEPQLATTYEYDSLSRVNRKIDSLGQATTYYYADSAEKAGADGFAYQQHTMKVVSPDGSEEFSFFDPYGRLMKTVAQTSTGNKIKTSEFAYTSMGQMTKQDVISGQERQTNLYAYDPSHRLVYLQDAEGQPYRFVYNRFDQWIERYVDSVRDRTNTYNEVGWLTADTDAAGAKTVFRYRNNGLLESRTDRAGQKATYAYTPYNEEQRVTYRNSTGQELYWNETAYDPTTRLVTAETTSEGEDIAYQYDGWKRKTGQTVAGRTYQLTYDAYDRLASLTYPDQAAAQYTYDSLGRMKTVTYPGMDTVTYDYTVGPNENRYLIHYGDDLVQETVRDGLEELVSVEHRRENDVLWAESYQQDGFGNISEIQNGDTTYTFAYDRLNRIKQETRPAGDWKYEYDPKGNRFAMEMPATILDGGLLSGGLLDDVSVDVSLLTGERQYTFNARNQLASLAHTAIVLPSTASYTYYGDGTRASKKVNGLTTKFIYVNGQLVEELDASGHPMATTVYGNEALYRKDRLTGLSGYYFTNGHTDVVSLRSDNGTPLNQYTYDIWGKLQTKLETMSNPFKFTGEYYDNESGLYYLSARYYDPELGRFIGEDANLGQVDNPLSLNLYTYVENNPLAYQDPTGEAAETVLDAASTAYSAYEFYEDPSWENALYLAWDATALVVPFVPGSYVSKATKLFGKSSKLSKLFGKSKKASKAKKAINACNCFTAGTEVQTDEGEKPIEDIEVGDQVLAKDDQSGEVGYKEVTATFHHETDEIYQIHVGEETIESTYNHPFWVKDKGWTFVKDLKVGDLLVQSDGNTLQIDSIEPVQKQATVYNMTVDDFHTYFVSDLGIWVHNTSCTYGPKYNEATSDQWYKGTFGDVTETMDYHLRKHGKGRTPEEFTKDAMDFFKANKHLAEEVTLSTGAKGYKIQTGTGKNKVGGYWTADGKLVTYWD
ncbi:polymorphic toxin-type HINT domain-containing protein [Gorillibacterium sp. sgz500922]|uniref:polymorphic toxin-type HINT domain-containing protein n=1 Tax=Gorillibacterium sp. sgz500922 TaxID=3446694 RepID=UPI003F677AC1